jgi:hypothetical protein
VTDTPHNTLSLDQVLALPDRELADLVATRYFGWSPKGVGYQHRGPDRTVAYVWRPFAPCKAIEDDRLALQWARKRARNLLSWMGCAMYDIARTRLRVPTLDPRLVTIYASCGDYCRALLLATSSTWLETWRREEAEHRARMRPTDQHKETSHGNLATTDPTSESSAAAPATADAAVSDRPLLLDHLRNARGSRA